MSAITAKASRKMKKYAVLTREPRCFLGSFDFSWEQRKVSDLAEKTYGGGTPTTSNEAYWNGDIPWIQSSDVVDGKLLGVEPRKWITQDGLNNSAAQLIPGNSIAIITRVGVGKLAFMPYSYATSQDFLSLSKLNAEPLFTVYACYKKLQSELNAVQGTSIKGITKDELLAKNIMVPRYAEQQQIGAFFKQLDNLITLHQRKCVFLFGFFQAFISMIFTASTFSWEQRKFSDITFPAGEKNRDNLPLESYSITNEHGFVPQDEKFENGGTMREADKRMYYIVSPNSFAYNPARINVGSIGYQNIGKNVIVSSLYEVFKTSEDVDDRLLWHWFKSPDFQKLIMQLQEGGVRLYFYYDKLCMGEVSLPSLEEQRKIGKLFDTLDNLITLHQRECISFTARAGRLILTANKKRNTSSWEQRKLGDIASDMVAGGDIDKDLILAEGQYPVIANALTGDGIVGYYDKEYRVNAPAVTVTGRGDVGHAKARLVNFTPVVRLLSVKSEHDVFFLENAINTLKIVIESTGVPQLTVPQLAKYEVAFPRQLDEEEHIGVFFKQLDHLITLHEYSARDCAARPLKLSIHSGGIEHACRRR